jgi:hypothetical protein
MFRNETECQEASKRLGDELKRLDEHRARLKDAGLGDVEIKRVSVENSKSSIIFEASVTYSLPRALRKASPSASSRDVWVCTKRKSLAMSETSISASHTSVRPRSWTRSTCGCGPRLRSNRCSRFP